LLSFGLTNSRRPKESSRRLKLNVPMPSRLWLKLPRPM